VTPSNAASPYADIAARQCPSIGEKKLTADMIEQLLGLPKAQLWPDATEK